MKKAVFGLLLLLTAVAVFTAGLQSSATAPPPAGDAESRYVPLKEHARVSKEIVKQLQQSHYRHLTFDDHLSEKVFQRYFDELDSARIYFVASDIKEFEQYRYTFDDQIRSGNLVPAFQIFNRYQLRLAERLDFVVKQLEQGLDSMNFDVVEEIETDRENSPWPESAAAMDDLWRKRLKSRVLKLKLDGKTLKEAQELLLKRYRNQQKRIDQVKNEDVFQLFINAVAQNYDPHTQYFSPRATENFNIHMSLSLEGIGAVLQAEQEYTKIVRLIPAGPADKSKKLGPADRIIGVGQGDDGEIVDVIGWRLDDVVELIRGPKGTVVRLEIIPADAADDHQTKIVEIVRNTVKLEEQSAQKKIFTLEHNKRTYKVGVIEIPTFYLDFKALQSGKNDFKSTTRDVQRLLAELNREKIDGLIIDLRNNGGGALQEVNVLTGLFIEEGPIVQVRDTKGKVEVLYDPDPHIYYRGPLAVLVNRLSASASEIFAGAIQDYHRGIIVGEQTYGKGTVQTLIPLSRGQLKATLAKFYRVTGESTQHKGVTPDILYPSPYNHDEIGESALPEALFWDYIEPVTYEDLPDISGMLAKLQERHTQRIKNDPDYTYLTELIAYLDANRDKTTISLKESVRKQEQEETEQARLSLENKRRTAKGLEPVKSLEEIEPETEPDPLFPHDNSTKDDTLLTETGHILADFIDLL